EAGEHVRGIAVALVEEERTVTVRADEPPPLLREERGGAPGTRRVETPQELAATFFARNEVRSADPCWRLEAPDDPYLAVRFGAGEEAGGGRDVGDSFAVRVPALDARRCALVAQGVDDGGGARAVAEEAGPAAIEGELALPALREPLELL